MVRKNKSHCENKLMKVLFSTFPDNAVCFNKSRKKYCNVLYVSETINADEFTTKTDFFFIRKSSYSH